MDRITGPYVGTLSPGARRSWQNVNPPTVPNGTQIDGGYMTAQQEELLAIIESAALTPSGGNTAQILQAARRLFSGNYTGLSQAVNGSSVTLTADNAGVVAVDATAGNMTLTLPAANAASGAVATAAVANMLAFTFLRLDNSSHTVSIVPAGSDSAAQVGLSGTGFTLAPGVLGVVSNGVNAWFGSSQFGRLRLTANMTFYVSTTGNDTTGNGTVGAPWATIQKAINWIYANVDSAGFKVTISVADGTYGPAAVSGPLPGGGALYLVGNVANPQNCIISNSTNYTACLQVNLFAVVFFSGFKFVNSAANAGYGVQAWQSGKAYQNGACQYGTCNGGHIISQDAGSTVAVTANYSIVGNAPFHYCSFYGALIAIGGSTLTVTVTVSGTPAFSTTFANTFDNGVILCGSVSITFSGSATGSRYAAFLGGIIDTAGSGATYFPGNAAGAVTSPGAYS